MNKELVGVRKFMLTFGQRVSDKIQLPTPEEMELRIKLLREEVDELEEAYKAGDIVGIADAHIDIDYINKGGYLIAGLQNIADDLFDEVQASNMSKLGEDGLPIYREDGKILKGPSYFQPNLKSIVEKEIENEKEGIIRKDS